MGLEGLSPVGSPGGWEAGVGISHTPSSSWQIENLRAFTEERAKLANADHFYLLLLAIPW